jgi:hypothetical protein
MLSPAIAKLARRCEPHKEGKSLPCRRRLAPSRQIVRLNSRAACEVPCPARQSQTTTLCHNIADCIFFSIEPLIMARRIRYYQLRKPWSCKLQDSYARRAKTARCRGTRKEATAAVEWGQMGVAGGQVADNRVLRARATQSAPRRAIRSARGDDVAGRIWMVCETSRPKPRAANPAFSSSAMPTPRHCCSLNRRCRIKVPPIAAARAFRAIGR